MSKPDGLCCANCRHKYTLEKWDYSHGGCDHSVMNGYACMSFAKEGIAVWMVGEDPDYGMCECYEPKEEKS